MAFFSKYGVTQHSTPNGQAYEWYYKPHGRRSPPKSELRLQVELPVDFEIEIEGGAARLAKWLGCATEFQTRDTAFDERFYIFSDDPQFHRLLAAESIRNEIKKIFTTGVRELTAQKGRLTAEMSEASITPGGHVPELVGILQNLIQKLKSLSSPNVGIACRKMALRAKIAIFLICALTGVSFCLLVVAPYKMADYWPVILEAAFYSLAPMGLGFLLIQNLFKHSSRGSNVFIYYLLFGLPGMVLATYVTLYTANYHYDTSAPTMHVLRILEKNTTHSRKGGTKYHIYSEGWHESGERFHIKVHSGDYERARTGGRLLVETHPGYLQFEWIGNYRVE